MANAEQLATLKKGAETWNERRYREWRLEPIDLSGADLSGSNLRSADLVNGNLTRANLDKANLSEANLRGTHLANAHLSYANLRSAILAYADLAHADLAHAELIDGDLSRANFSDAKLIGANLSGAALRETLFVETDLSNIVGLDSCRHLGPSTLDHRTLAQSGPLPLAFLRGCGLPESLITYLPSLLNQPIQFYSCFISYSTKDQAFADRLHADLQNKGVRCWFAPHDMAPGKKIHEQIDEAIRLHDKLLLILSEHSMNSEWVKTEIRKARKRELADQRRMLFPVSLVGFKPLKEWECFDAEIGKDSAVEIREFFIPDFSTWKSNHDAYQENFDRLVKSLQTKDDSTAAKG